MIDAQPNDKNDRNANGSAGANGSESAEDPMTIPSVEQPADPKPDHEKEEAIRLDPIEGDDDDADSRESGDAQQ